MITIFMMTRKKNFSQYGRFDGAAEKKELFGQGSHKVFKIGDSVKIRVDKVNIAKAEIDFALI